MSKIIKLLIRLPFVLIAITFTSLIYMMYWLFATDKSLKESKSLKEVNEDILKWLLQ